MAISELCGPVRRIFLLSLLALPACTQTAPPSKAAADRAQAAAMVISFYKEVLIHRPIAGMGEWKVFAPYLSKALLERFDDNRACLADWHRKHPGTTDKPPFGQLEMGVYSGGAERSSPQTFRIAKTEPLADGSYRVTVNLTYTEPSFKLAWSVVAVVVRENNAPVVDDVIYLKDKDNPEGGRLSEVLLAECNGPRWNGQS